MFNLFGSSQIDQSIDQATSEYLPAAQEDLAITLEVCDLIKSKQVAAHDAMKSLRRRLVHKNPNVQILALKLTDACIKNTGHHFLIELASREFVDTLANIAAKNPEINPEVRSLALSYLQIWALLFQPHQELSYMYEVYEELLRANMPFPPPPRRLDQAIVKTLAPPEWTDSDVCSRCRVSFNFSNRKHHCRNCGKTFCHDCSAKVIPLPELGILQEVRVCEGCFVAKQKIPRAIEPIPTLPNSPNTEDEDISKAIKLSLEASQATPQKAPTIINKQEPTLEEEEAMLAAAIAASLEDVAHSKPATSLYSSKVISSYTDPQPISIDTCSTIPAAPSAHPAHRIASLDGQFAPGNSSYLPKAIPSTIEHPPSTPPPISTIERENTRLFSELMSHLVKTGGSKIVAQDKEIKNLAEEMSKMRDRILGQIESGRLFASTDINRILGTLKEALEKYEQLISNSNAASESTANSPGYLQQPNTKPPIEKPSNLTNLPPPLIPSLLAKSTTEPDEEPPNLSRPPSSDFAKEAKDEEPLIEL